MQGRSSTGTVGTTLAGSVPKGTMVGCELAQHCREPRRINLALVPTHLVLTASRRRRSWRSFGISSSNSLKTTPEASCPSALWSSSAGKAGLIGALNRAYGVTEARPWSRQRAIAILLTVGVAVLLLSSTSWSQALSSHSWWPAVSGWVVPSRGPGRLSSGPWCSS